MALSMLGIGTFLPSLVRRNDAWSQEIVDRWQERGAFSPERAREATGAVAASGDSEGAERVFAAMRAHGADPFHGAIERRIMPPGMTAVDMGAAAAEAALADAGVARSDIDFVLGSSFVPDLMNSSDACGVHAQLGLRPNCLVLSADAVCNSFQMQLALAAGLVAGGTFRRGLLIQATAASRITPLEAPFSVHFGDGASAVVVGEGTRRTIVGQKFAADTSIYRAMVATVPGKDWWEDGRVWATPLDKEASRRMLPDCPDAARSLLHALLQQQSLGAADVDFFACHQPTIWFRQVIQDHVGMSRARAFDTYPEAGTVSAANIPLILDRARGLDLLHEGDLVAFFQGGTGATHAASLVRW